MVRDQMVGIGKSVERTKKSEKEQKKDAKSFIQDLRDEDPMEKADYLARNCFENRGTKQIDMEYVQTLTDDCDSYRKTVEEKVNTYTTSFTFDQMDMIDQSIFLLGYIEYLKLKTPKEVLLNEMVELSKRYGDEGSSKLINGILHHMIVEIDGGEHEKKEEISNK